MADYENLLDSIDAVIRSNNRREITGQILQNTLHQMVASLGENYQLAGFATPTLDPSEPDQNVFYLTDEAGVYTNFDNITLGAGLSFLMWKNEEWTSKTLDVVTADWLDEHYVSKAFLRKVFQFFDEDGVEIFPNDTESVVDNIKAMCGLWTNEYLSALGLGEGGTIPTTLAALNDVTITDPQDGQALVYDAASLHWVNATIQSGVDMSVVWAALAAATNEQINATHLSTALASYVTTTALNTTLESYVTTTALATALASYASQSWVESNYVSKAFFNSLFQAEDASGNAITPNNANSTTIDRLKILVGAYTEQYLSALGLSAGGGGGSTTLAGLTDVTITDPQNGQALIYDAQSTHWINGEAMSMSVVWTALAAATNEQINSSHLTTALSGYVTTSALSTELASYVTTSALASELANYVTTSGLSTTLADYVTSTALSTTLASYATQSWVDNAYVSKAFFNAIFQLEDAQGNVISPNADTTAKDRLKILVGAYTEQYLSALGLSAGGGGYTLNEPLSSINSAALGTPSQANVAIVWNGTTWTYGTTMSSVSWNDVTNKPTTLAGYGITDAYISNGTITLGANSITPLTSHQSLADLMGSTVIGGTTQPIYWNGSAWANTSYTLGAACAKGVTDNSSSTAVTSSDTNLITGRTLYYAGYTKNVGTVTSVATGTGLTGGTITSSGTISIDSTYQTYISHGESAYNSLSNYLPLSGGTLTGNLTINRANKSDYSLNTNGKIGVVGTADIGQATNGTATIDAFDGIAFYGCDAVNNGAINSGKTGYIAIKNSGNIGIGLTNPSYKLEVNGSTYADSFIKKNGTSAQFLKADGSVDTNSYVTSSGVTSVATGTGLTGGTITSTGTISINSTYQTYISNGNTAYGWGNHANAGYATQSWVNTQLGSYLPLIGGTLTGKLSVNRTNKSDIAITTNGVLSIIGTGNIGQNTNGTATIDAFGGYAYFGCDALENGAIASGKTGYISINGYYGNVGIGKNPDSYKLDVNGSLRAQNITTTATNTYAIGSNGMEFANADIRVVWLRHINYSRSYGLDKDVYIQHENDCGNTYLNTYSGNVGIGTTSPTQKLHVNGNIIAGDSNGNFLQVGSIRLIYDSTNNAIKVEKNDGTAANFYATGGVSALGDGVAGGGTGYLPLTGGILTGNLSIEGGRLAVGQNTDGTAEADAYNGYAYYSVDRAQSIGKYGFVALKNKGYGSIGLGISPPTLSSDDETGCVFAKGFSAYDGNRRKANLYANSEGGNLYLESPNSEHGWEMDDYNNSALRFISFVRGDVRALATLSSYCVWTAYGYNNASDMRLKDVVKNISLSIENIANAPAFSYTWKSSADKSIHVGTSAQYWRDVLPNVVSEADDEIKTLSMQYGVAALISSITIARKVVDHEQRITELEKERDAWKEAYSFIKNAYEQLKLKVA